MPNGEEIAGKKLTIPIIAGVGVLALGVIMLTGKKQPPPIEEKLCDNVNFFNPTARITVEGDTTIVGGKTMYFSSTASTDVEDTSFSGSNIQWEILNSSRQRIFITRGITLNYTFNNPGNYYAKLTVNDSDGCTDTDELPIVVLDPTDVSRTIALYYARDSSRTTNRTADKEKWDSLIELISESVRVGGYYHGKNKYIANIAGEILPWKSPIEENSIFDAQKDIRSLANWIRNGGVWIDYTDYPIYYSDFSICLFGACLGDPNRWNYLMNELGIEELGGTITPNIILANSTFFVRDRIKSFPYERSLAIVEEKPQASIFKTSDMITALQENVPYERDNAYSMFALKVGQGIYFYSNRDNSPEDYAIFIDAVHNNKI